MSKPKSIHERVNTLEQQMTEVHGKADAAIYLAREADRDVTDMRVELSAHKKVLQALRETQIEQGKEIRELRTEMREGFSTVGVGVAHITALLTVALEGPQEAPS